MYLHQIYDKSRGIDRLYRMEAGDVEVGGKL